MSKPWITAVDDAADTLGEMLIELANGEAPHSHEDIAAAALRTGLSTLLGEGPDPARINATARALYDALHDQERQTWNDANEIDRQLWRDIAAATIRASDDALLQELED